MYCVGKWVKCDCVGLDEGGPPVGITVDAYEGTGVDT